MLIKNAYILTMDKENIENGFILTEGGKIKKVGRMKDCPECEEAFDAGGLYVCPGFVDSHSHIGMWEDSLNAEGDDGNEDTDPVTPHLRAIDAVNPMDYAFREALSNGVTTVVTGPGSANPVSGQFIAMKTYGIRIDDMKIKEPAAMKMALGENPKGVYHAKNQSPSTRMGTAALIREALNKAKKYAQQLKKYELNPEEEDEPDYDIKMEALKEVVEGGLLVKFHAHRADDIFTALRIKNEFGLNATIEHCTDGYLIAKYLKEENVGVCVGPLLTDRSKPELANLSFKNVKALLDEGIRVSIITDHPIIPQKHLALCAALAAKEAGISKDLALLTITRYAAENAQIGHRVGSIKEGLDADILFFDRHPLDFEARLLKVMAGGKFIDFKEGITK